MMLESLRKVFLSGLGALSLTKEKLKTLIEDLIKRGELTEKQAKPLLEELWKKVQESKSVLEERIGTLVQKWVKKMDLVSREEFEELKKRVATLEKRKRSTPRTTRKRK